MPHSALLKPAALSPDGYIINQDQVDNIPYGFFKSSFNGCGWIAAWNLLRYLGDERDPLTLSQSLAAGTPLRGLGGTSPRRLRRFLVGQGLPMYATTSKKHAPAFARRARAGIVYYLDEREPHLVAFTAAGGGRLRFFNVDYGNAEHLLTMRQFLSQHAKASLFYLMVTR